MLSIIARYLKYESREIRIKNTRISAQLADSRLKRLVGLMYRKELQRGGGMLFVFGATGRYGIWMKNMRFPIDIAWLDDGKKIVHAVHSAQPCRAFLCEVYKPASPSRYVLELRSGFLKDHGLKVGDMIAF